VGLGINPPCILLVNLVHSDKRKASWLSADIYNNFKRVVGRKPGLTHHHFSFAISVDDDERKERMLAVR
jgi:hypothetical protein